LSKQPPRLTLLWLNFNSMRIIGLIRESIDAMLALDYPNFEALLLDNASTDGSYEALVAHLKGKGGLQKPGVRVIRTAMNLGYTGGFDFGYRARDPASSYVAVVSDDAILEKGYARLLVGEMERDPSIGGIQGIVTTLDGKRVDSAGVLVDKLMIPHHIRRGEAVGTEAPAEVSFVEGTCPVYRVSALQEIMPGHLFYPQGFFQYLEDNLNGLLLWNKGYRCVSVPRVVARHAREAGGGGLLRTYCLWRNRTALVKLTDSRLKPLEYAFASASLIYMLASKQTGKARLVVKGVYDGHGLAKRMRAEHGFRISLAKVPMYRLGKEYIGQLLSKSKGRGRLDEMDL
jgi:GT2 family glycosyltransferase